MATSEDDALAVQHDMTKRTAQTTKSGARKTQAGLCQEAENASGRDNTEALVYRMGQVYKRVDEANKMIWAVKKDLQQKKKNDNWEE